MLIGVVSDTHGHIPYTTAAVTMLETFEVSLVIHCGDVGSEAIPPLFARWPAHFVLGNVDYDSRRLVDSMTAAGLVCHGRFGSLTLEGKRIAFLHGDDSSLLRQTVCSGDWDLVCHGHTHKAEQRREGKTLVLNPGAIFRANPRSIAIVDLPKLQVTVIPIS